MHLLLKEKEEYILSEIKKEADRFEATLAQGIKEFEKCIAGIARKNAFMDKLFNLCIYRKLVSFDEILKSTIM